MRALHLFGLLLIILPFSTWGLSTDAKEPAHFKSTDVTFNHKTGLTIFTGNVQMDQGTTHLVADKVSIYKDSEGKIIKVVAIGELAHYTTLPDKQKKEIHALAKTIEYYPKDKKAVLLQKATITQGENAFSGEHIIYNIAQQVVTSLPNSSGSRSVLIIQPQDMPGNNAEQKT